MFNFLFRSRSSVVERTTFNRDAVGSTPTAIILKFQKKLSYINILQKIKIQKLAKRIIVIYNIINELIKIKYMDENKNFIKEQDFYENLRILYIEKTKKIHVALTNTNGTEGYKDKKEKYYKGIEKDEYDEKYTKEINGLSDKLDTAFKNQYQDEKSIKEKKLITRAIPNIQVSSMSILFDLIEEILLNPDHQNLKLNFKNTPGYGGTKIAKAIADRFADKEGKGLEEVKDINRMGRTYAFMLKFSLVIQYEIITCKNTDQKLGIFESQSMHQLLRRHLGDNYLSNVESMGLISMIRNIKSLSDSVNKDYQYEIEFKQDSKNLKNLQEFLQHNPSKKKSNGMEIIDSKLFMKEFFPNFARENLVCKEIVVQKIYEVEKNIINNESDENQAISSLKEEDGEDVFEDALDGSETTKSNKFLSTSGSTVSKNSNITITPNDENNINKQNELELNKDLNENQSKQPLNNDSNDTENKKNKNSKQENQSDSTKNAKTIHKKICNFLARVKNLLLLRSEFKITIKKIQKLNKELKQINKQLDSLDKNGEGYKKCVTKHNELLQTYGELLKKAGNLIKRSESAKNEAQKRSREVKLIGVNKLTEFKSIEVRAA